MKVNNIVLIVIIILPVLTVALFLPQWTSTVNCFFDNATKFDVALFYFVLFINLKILIKMIANIYQEYLKNESKQLKDLAKKLDENRRHPININNQIKHIKK